MRHSPRPLRPGRRCVIFALKKDGGMRLSVVFLMAAALAAAAWAAPALDAATASLDELMSAAEEAYQTGDEARGDELLAAAEDRFPDNEELAQFRASWLIYNDNYEGALAVIDEWLAVHPNADQWLRAKVRVSRKVGRNDDALAALDRLAELGGGPGVAFERGDLYVAKEPPDYGKAAESYEAGLAGLSAEERLEYPEVLYNLSCSYARLGDAEAALDCLAGALDADPLFVRQARGDEDLASIKGTPRFEDLVAGAETRADEAEAAKMTVKPGEPAPAFTLTDIYDKEYALADFRGKYVVLNIWATWCPPCRNEIPEIVEFAKAHEGEATVVSISVDEPGEDVLPFVRDYGINYVVLRDDGEVANKYISATGGIPQTYFIDREGVVRGHIYGSADRQTFEERLGRLIGGGD
jgi:peroxiredoxin